ncbi:NAD(P)-dependent oxidoreductase [Ollibium composti]|uniref:NAD(P)-dependent oxidoreductase n=1 Tax=Ollibium composti TaxID=2675109 RepID=A0ABY2Q1M8_9HYPH|nr:NAD(P)-dependent oxidoreductase [Mesorhizobium composti]THF54724.1 NAD(P)-dependent oxidoreductase [Mesorhizobium composti]
MKIALIGASGFVGSALLKEAVARGHSVTAIVRNPGKIAEAKGVAVVQADVTDAAALAALLKGHDVVVSAFNGGWGDPDIYAKHIAGSKAIAAAARAAGVRLIEIGGAGSLHAPDGSQLVDSPEFPTAYKDGARAARDALTALQQGDWKDWTLVSPAITLAPGQRTGHYRLGADNPVFNTKGESHISVEDFAVAVLDEAETPKHSGKRFTVGY